MTVHSHVRLQFRYLGNRSALALKPHQKQTYLFRARSFIAKHGVLLYKYYFRSSDKPLLMCFDSDSGKEHSVRLNLRAGLDEMFVCNRVAVCT